MKQKASHYHDRVLLVIVLLFTLSMQGIAQELSLEDIWLKGTFSAKGVAGFTSMNDGRYYIQTDDKQNLLRYAFADGKLVDTIVLQSTLKAANHGVSIDRFDFTMSADESKILLATMTEMIYRHSSKSLYYVYDLKTGKLVQPITEKVRYATFSPDGSKLAYVKENDLYLYDLLRNQETRITKDGAVNSIINGATDWVYEEEFSMSQAFQWNAAGDKIAFFRFDESKVKAYSMPIYGELYPKDETFKYPKAGEANSVVNIFVYDLKTELIAEMETGKVTDQYIPRIQWTNQPNQLFIQRLNRLQNKLEYLLADANTGKSTVVLTDENKSYVDITDDLTFLKDNKHFLISSERDGFKHLYLYDMKGKMVKQLTKGAWDVADFYGIDEAHKLVYFAASVSDPSERYVYSVKLSGKDLKAISTGKGWHAAAFNSDFTYYLDAFSSMNTPATYALRNASGAEVRMLEPNEELVQKMKAYKFSPAVFSTITNAVGDKMPCFTIYPANFDSTKKYPVLMYVYGGPGSQTVMNRWSGSNYLWYQLLAKKGYMIVSVDGRGTGFKGEAYKKCTYLNLGKLEIEDQIFAATSLSKLPYVDPTRIGIWGWSFGGYMSSLGISKGAQVFKAAIAVAPVTNWRYYDNIYTERFMRTPQENGANYDDNSPISHVDQIKGNYLLIHGTADDNVHFQNSVDMVDAMIKKGVRYDSEFYPNKNHGIGGAKTRFHLYDRMTRFILEKL